MFGCLTLPSREGHVSQQGHGAKVRKGCHSGRELYVLLHSIGEPGVLEGGAGAVMDTGSLGK